MAAATLPVSRLARRNVACPDNANAVNSAALQLLVAPLHRAVPLPQGHHASVGEPEDLHLDVPYAREEPLHQHGRITEHPLGEAVHPLQLGPQRVLVGRHRHAHAAAAGGGLDHHRVADLAGSGYGRLGVPDRLGGAREHRHTGGGD